MDNYVIYPNGYEEVLFPKEKDGRFTVAQLQDIVSGYIGVEDVGEKVMVFNDSSENLYNRRATELAGRFGIERMLSGPVVILNPGMIKTG